MYFLLSIFKRLSISVTPYPFSVPFTFANTANLFSSKWLWVAFRFEQRVDKLFLRGRLVYSKFCRCFKVKDPAYKPIKNSHNLWISFSTQFYPNNLSLNHLFDLNFSRKIFILDCKLHLNNTKTLCMHFSGEYLWGLEFRNFIEDEVPYLYWLMIVLKYIKSCYILV